MRWRGKLDLRTPGGKLGLGAIFLLVLLIVAISGEGELLPVAFFGAAGAICLIAGLIQLLGQRKEKENGEDPWDR